MPSWNIHIAHAERLLKGSGSVARAVRDRNAFLFGNLVPDIYVGYMVPGVARPVPYRVTHFAKPEHIPKPRAGEFFDAYVSPFAREAGTAGPGDEAPWFEAASLSAEVEHVSPAHAPSFEWEFDVRGTAARQRDAFGAAGRALSPVELRRSLFDMVLGAWVHLLADCTWNQAVSDLLETRGERPSRDFRIKKQGDFDLFGKSLALDLMPRLTPQLIDVAAAFPQYEIDAASVAATCAIAHETVRTNHPVAGASYRLLDEGFFDRVFAEVNDRAERKLEYMAV